MISCQGCGLDLMELATEVETIARGRYKGWRIFDGTSEAGTSLQARWCPSCVDKNRPRTPKAPPTLDGQELFDL